MSEVKRYHVQLFKLDGHQQRYAHGALGAVEIVRASDFDRVQGENKALQERLTVQDQREDDLADLLTHAHIAINAMAPGFFLLEKIEAALNPTAKAASSSLVPECATGPQG